MYHNTIFKGFITPIEKKNTRANRHKSSRANRQKFTRANLPVHIFRIKYTNNFNIRITLKTGRQHWLSAQGLFWNITSHDSKRTCICYIL